MPTIHMIGNAHLDPAWMWTWDEGMEAFLATARSALDRMEEFDDFVFTCSSAAHYRWIEEVAPGLFERVRLRVKEGRWAIVGGWWVQADCNIPSGEGFARQALHGQRYFLERFGRIAHTGYSPDAFGHDTGLPQLLSRAGMNGYVFCRPDPTELVLPSPLVRWFSPDGSSVLAYRVPYHYNMYESSVPKKVGDLSHAMEAATELTGNAAALTQHGSNWMLFYGVGNHGGGPTREHIRQIIELAGRDKDTAILFSDPDRYFASLPADTIIPEWRNDLQLNAPGCYSAHSLIKHLHRRSEHALAEAERWGSLATMLARYSYPEMELRRAWERICFNAFHDLLCGVATREALDDAIAGYGAALSVATQISRTARAIIAGEIDTRGEGQSVIVFNPHAFPFYGNVTGELWHDIDKSLWSHPVHLRLTDDEGNEIPVGIGYTSGKIGRDRVAFTFPAEIPPLGWQTYRLFYGQQSTAKPTGSLQATGTTLENDLLRVEIDPATGASRRIYDRKNRRELLSGCSAIPVAIEDQTDTWGHGVERFDRVIGEFGNADVRCVESTPTYATIRSRVRWSNSWVQHDYRLDRHSHLLHIDVKLFWGEEETMLKFRFHVNAKEPVGIAEGAYAVVEKEADGTERPKGRWCAIVDRAEDVPTGIFIADNAKSGYSAEGSLLSLSILRSPCYAAHDPHPMDSNEDRDYLDQGLQRFTYVIGGINGELWMAEAARVASILSSPPSIIIESAHAGGDTPLPSTWSGILVDPETVIVTALKRSWDGAGWTIRLHETTGRASDVHVRCAPLDIAWRVMIEPYGVRTFHLGEGSAREVDLVEM